MAEERITMEWGPDGLRLETFVRLLGVVTLAWPSGKVANASHGRGYVLVLDPDEEPDPELADLLRDRMLRDDDEP